MKRVWEKRKQGIDTSRKINRKTSNYATKIFPGTFVSPDDEKYTNIKNLSKFSKLMGLIPQRMYAVFHGKSKNLIGDGLL